MNISLVSVLGTAVALFICAGAYLIRRLDFDALQRSEDAANDLI